jgi:hypothetical protein
MRTVPPAPRLFFAVAALILLAACDHYAAAKAQMQPSLTPAPSPAPAPVVSDVCAAPDVGAPVTVDLVVRADGSCAPFRQAFAYRCDPVDPAVAVVDDGRGIRRFLGGSYAVPVPALPPQAFAIGVTGFGALYQDPSDPSFLWVEADGTVSKWLALPNPNKLSDPVTVQMIGDSILDGGQTEVVAGLPDWTVSIDALIGRGSDGAAGVAESLPSPAADVVLIEIGVNDADASYTAANAQRIIAAQGDARVLVWLTAHGPEPQVPAVNQAIFDAMGPLSNGAVLDWNNLVPLDALSSDGIHPDAGRQGTLASIIDPYLQGWLDAVEGRGATACQNTIHDHA